MAKKFLLALVSLGCAGAAYFLLAANDRPKTPEEAPQVRDDIRRFVVPSATSAPASTIRQGNISFSPGENTRFRVYDEVTNRLKYVFEAEKWEPVNDARFRVVKLNIEIYTPKGQITYIQADESEVDMVKNARGTLDPKRGFVRGNVQVVMDRTTLEWREAHHDQAAADAHPDQLIRIWLDEAKFDMDLAELTSDSTILIDSADVRIERVAGLTLQWNQKDNRIDSLHFRQGGLMKLRRGGRMIDFGLPGTDRDAKVAQGMGGGVMANAPVSLAMANQPVSLEPVSAEAAASEIRSGEESSGGAVGINAPRSLNDTASTGSPGDKSRDAPSPTRTPEEFVADLETMKSEVRLAPAGVATQPSDIVSGQRGKKKVDSYRAIFNGSVVIEQSDGMKTIGKLEADRLEINFDFGRKQKDLASADKSKKSAAAPGGAGAAAPEGATDLGPPIDLATAPPSDAQPPEDADDKSKITLSWNGPLELRPIQVDADIQTGDRFDAIATGLPVKVHSDRGDGTCTQLVYRHERRQVWLTGTEQIPADMGVGPNRRLRGREVYFDQKRGLARVEGPGNMVDSRTGSGDEGDAVMASFGETREPAVRPGKSGKPRDPVNIQWARGVDIEIGTRLVERMNPSTGLTERKRREYLRRAWFHGDVSVAQGKHTVAGDELAVTFGTPAAGEDVAAQIDHIDVMNNVRLGNDKDFISAERLEVQMAVNDKGRSVARVADATGGVFAKQGTLEFRAAKMHVMLAPGRDEDKMGIESLDATGGVEVFDPDTNLKISRCGALSTKMSTNNQLTSAIIVAAKPDVYARVRYSDFAVHGQRVEIDATREAIAVPGPGRSWMVTRQDLNGRKLQRPTAIKTEWNGRMLMELGQDYGVFEGGVRSITDTFAMDSDKLTVRFMPAPPDEKTTDGKSRFWVLGAIMGDKAGLKHGDKQALPSTKRKRPAQVVADGHVVALTSTYAPDVSEGVPGRLLSRLRVAGDQIAADLRREEMWVPGAGTLLIEDYQFEAGNTARLAKAATDTGPLMSSLHKDGPSQTVIKWGNSMKFFVDQNLVSFDREVEMVHRSGQQMVMQKELAEAMHLDERLVHLSKGRRGTLACENLIVEFETKGKSGNASKASLTGESSIRATDLHRLIAKGGVHLQESGKSLMGQELTYQNDSQIVTLLGGVGTDARIYDMDESGQAYNMWQGPRLIWNRLTNQVDAPGAKVRSGRR